MVIFNNEKTTRRSTFATVFSNVDNMHYSLALLALAAAAVNASPFAFPQAVTAIITPSGSAPPGCMPTFVGSFGIAVQNISTAAMARRQVTEITE